LLTVQATDAEYKNVYWPEQGLILASNNYGPADQARGHRTSQRLPGHGGWNDEDNLPQLKNWSDLTFLIWMKLTESRPERHSELKYVFRNMVQSESTKNIVATILRNRAPANMKSQPGIGYAPDQDHPVVLMPGDENFDALLSSDNVKGVAYLLFQHKDVFGEKTIKKLSIWEEPIWDAVPYHDPSILVEIGLVQPRAPSTTATRTVTELGITR
jgi:hypothetical protein